MARTKPLSPAAKRRILLRQEAKLRRELDRVLDKIEVCETCNADKLEKEARKLEQKHERERVKLAKKLGVDASDLAGGKKKKATKKKAAKKKTASKKSTKKKAAKKKAAKKKTAKRSTKKKASKKKTSKESG